MFDILKRLINKTSSFEFVKNMAPNEIGVYIFYLNDQPKYVGRAIEQREGQSTSGLRKRLQEHWRGSGNTHVFSHKEHLSVSFRTCDSVNEAKNLEAQLIREYDTVKNGWNMRYEGDDY